MRRQSISQARNNLFDFPRTIEIENIGNPLQIGRAI